MKIKIELYICRNKLNNMICFPNAKINIGLNVIEKRNDGFHNIESVFLPVKLCDVLEFIEIKKAKKNSSVLKISGIPIEGDNQNNLCMKAYNLLAKDFDLPKMKIHLHKIIPMQAGLGGGSADAAFLLKSINAKYNLGLTIKELKKYASAIGSDCSFFIENKAAFASGKGDILELVNLNLANKYITIIKPNINISTPEAYSGISPQKPKNSLKELIQLPIKEWKHKIHNDFEDRIFAKFEYLKEIKTQLYNLGADYAAMSGSGSAIYGIFEKKTKIEKLFDNCFIWQGIL